jgi:hypothetical protein
VAAKKPKPIAKLGDRNEKCDQYDKCLTFAARQDWRRMSCEACPFFKDQKQKPGAPKMENKRICKECGERPTMQPASPYCSKCLNDMKRAKQSADSAPKKKNEGTDKPKAVNIQKTVDTVVKIDFGRYISVLKEIEKLADKEMRPLGFQVAYILQKHLENIGVQ